MKVTESPRNFILDVSEAELNAITIALGEMTEDKTKEEAEKRSVAVPDDCGYEMYCTLSDLLGYDE